jgi:hypothetical protein
MQAIDFDDIVEMDIRPLKPGQASRGLRAGQHSAPGWRTDEPAGADMVPNMIQFFGKQTAPAATLIARMISTTALSDRHGKTDRFIFYL